MSERRPSTAEGGTPTEISRRELLAAGGVAAAVGLAGCIYHGPFPGTSLSVSVREPFEPDPPVAVPLRVDVSVQNVNSKDVALRGVELGFYDAERERQAGRRLGDFSWRDADPERREVSEYDGGFFTTIRAYSASWTLEPTLDAPEVPAWITFDVEEVWFGDDDAAQASVLPVGRARASQPPPELSATINRFELGPPLPPTVDSDGFSDLRLALGAGVHEDEALLPEPATEPDAATAEFWYSSLDGERFESAVESFNQTSKHTIEAGAESSTRVDRALAGAFSTRPHLFALEHTRVVDYAERRDLSNQARALDVQLEEAFTEAAIQAVHVEGRTYGLPYATAPAALFYNRSMIEEPPETVPEWTAMMDRHHDPDAGRYGLCYRLSHPYFYSAWAHAFGGYFYDTPSGSLGLTLRETLRGIEFVVDTLAPYTSANPTVPAEQRVFVERDAPFSINRPAYLSEVEAAGIDVGVAPLPTPDGGTPRPYTFVETLYFTEEMDRWDGREGTPAARAFAEWYATNEDRLVEDAVGRGSVPVHRAAIERGELPETIAGFVAAAETAIPVPPSSKMEAVYPRVQEAFEAVLAGDRSAESAFAEAEDGIRTAWSQGQDD